MFFFFFLITFLYFFIPFAQLAVSLLGIEKSLTTSFFVFSSFVFKDRSVFSFLLKIHIFSHFYFGYTPGIDSHPKHKCLHKIASMLHPLFHPKPLKCPLMCIRWVLEHLGSWRMQTVLPPLSGIVPGCVDAVCSKTYKQTECIVFFFVINCVGLHRVAAGESC